jgi:hypothetical protein
MNLNFSGASGGSFDISIIDAQGRICLQERRQLDLESLTFDTSDFRPGLYLVKISDDKNQAVLRIVKQ